MQRCIAENEEIFAHQIECYKVQCGKKATPPPRNSEELSQLYEQTCLISDLTRNWPDRAGIKKPFGCEAMSFFTVQAALEHTKSGWEVRRSSGWFLAVPPGRPSIYNERGILVDKVLGPYNEGSDLMLTCSVAGGKKWRTCRLSFQRTLHFGVTLSWRKPKIPEQHFA